MKITRLGIANLRAIALWKQDLTLLGDIPRQRIILLGANGAGKTAVLRAIARLIQEMSGDDEFGADAILAGEVRQPATQAAIELEFAVDDDTIRKLRPMSGQVPPRGKVVHYFARSPMASLLPPLGNIAFGVPLYTPSSFGDLVRSSQELPAVFIPADRGRLEYDENLTLKSLSYPAPKEHCLALGHRRFETLAARLALALSDPKRHDRHGRIARMWKVLAKYVTRFPQPIDVDNLLMFFQTADGVTVPLPRLSDGERALLLIMAEVAFRWPENGMILIDEPEQHLHPRWQREMMDALTSLLPSAQLIVATQAAYLAASAPSDVFEIGDWKQDGE
jgi:ABC-type branched-subunit amino acid transport system ATPase component